MALLNGDNLRDLADTLDALDDWVADDPRDRATPYFRPIGMLLTWPGELDEQDSTNIAVAYVPALEGYYVSVSGGPAEELLEAVDE